MFSELSLHPSLLKALSILKIERPTEVQAASLPAIMAGDDLMISAETGSGKTAAFLLPILNRCITQPKASLNPRALVLVPTRELANQVYKNCESLGRYTRVTPGLVIGGESFRQQASMLRKNPEVLVATPGRLIEHIHKGSLKLTEIETLVLDEADRMLDMGFAEEVMEIVKFCPEQRQTLLLSATLNHRGIKTMSEQVLSEPKIISVDTVRDNHSAIKQSIIFADDSKQKAKMLAALIQQEQPTKTVVFTNTKTQADQLGGLMRYHKIDTLVLHGDMTQDLRKQVTHKFRNSRTQLLVATDVAARGLDIKNVGLVVNFDFPRGGDDYVHRIGRTGRAGQSGTAVSFVMINEYNLMSSVERYLNLSFERRKLDGFEVEYKGPKKLKASGKAASNKKRKPAGKSTGGKKVATKKAASKKTAAKKVKGKATSAVRRDKVSGDSPPVKRKRAVLSGDAPPKKL
ncbi:superfamily II DNA/RNA helicase [Sinobacterium caligoides]|uniref:Superfamily II DNA/RNA helicase n=1 Tax=Sinobacterium caligoides TaxID=933926 RepID=A0A3N2DYK8_9GAMM|nr:DEAD/DEAH box helicase [Sinobacterium caligoides]ROS04933.1 superfamily II DNA/RNA helicase [Sinobacterium caligoides]